MHNLSRRAWLAGAAMAAQAPGQPVVRLPQKVRIAIIGLEGHIGQILEPLDRLPDVELVAIYDRNPSLMREVSNSKHGAHARLYANWRDLLDGEKLDIAGICGTNGERAEIILECARRKLHVVAEKPLAITRPDLERIRKAVSDSGIHLTMLIEMRFEAPYRALKQIVDSGEIGEVAQIGAQKSYKLGDRPDWMRHRATFGGTIPYIAVHMVDLMRWTSSRELVQVFSFEGRVGYPELQDMENVTTSLFKLDNGGSAALRMDYLRPETAATWGDDRLRLAGTRGIAEFQEHAGLTLVTDKSPMRKITDMPPGGSLFIDFLNSVYTGAAPSLVLRDIYRVCEIVLAARDSGDQNQIVQL